MWIASDCLDKHKHLLFRQCVGDEWVPSNDEVLKKPLCYYGMNNEVRVCPFSYTTVHIQVYNFNNNVTIQHDIHY